MSAEGITDMGAGMRQLMTDERQVAVWQALLPPLALNDGVARPAATETGHAVPRGSVFFVILGAAVVCYIGPHKATGHRAQAL